MAVASGTALACWPQLLLLADFGFALIQLLLALAPDRRPTKNSAQRSRK